MLHIDDLIDPIDLADAIEAGFVREQTDPDGMRILNYTEQAVYSRTWTVATLTCRGLIVAPDGTVAARPWMKFFNHGEPAAAGTLDLAAPVEVTDKADGSLGILHRDMRGEPRIATRGSFASEQAIWATNWFRRYANFEFFDIANKTYLFEILAHWNRIVVQYDWEGLVLLSIIDTETGRHDPLPGDPWLLQARAARDDSGEHAGQERLEDVPLLHPCEQEKGLREEQGPSCGISEAVETREPGQIARVCEPGVRDTPRSNGGGEGAPVHGLWIDVPSGVHGLRSCARTEADRSVAGAKPEAVFGGDREVRAHLRELPSSQDKETPNGAPEAFRIIQRFGYRTLTEALEAPPRPNAEGLVVRYLAGPLAGTMLKIKQADYVALHRIITGLTARRIWERAAVWAIRATLGDTYPVRHLAQQLRMDVADVQGIIDAGPTWRDDIVKTAPEEFTEWIDATHTGLADQAQEIVDIIEGEALGHRDRPRRDVAADIADHPYRGMVFAALDGKPYLAQAWAAIRPAAEKPFAARSEDVS